MTGSLPRWTVVALLAGVPVLSLAGATEEAPAAAPSAESLIAKVRASLGAPDAWSAVKGVTVSGRYRRPGDHEVKGDLSITVAPPDILVTDRAMTFYGNFFRNVDVLTAGRAWWGRQSPGGKHVFDRDSAAPEREDERARYRLAFLLGVPDPQLTFKLVAEAEAPEGRAYVLEASAATHSIGRLFVDTKTLRPVMLVYDGQRPRKPVALNGADFTVRKKEDGKTEVTGGPRVAAAAAADRVEMTLYLADFRAVDGILFPHEVTVTAGEEPVEEMHLDRVRINPEIKPEQLERSRF